MPGSREKVKTPRLAWALTGSGHFFTECLELMASAAPVGLFYHGVYHTLVLAPATSNTIAKCVAGISDTLATNVYAQAGKCRVPSIVFACDTAPELETMAPSGMVKVYPRRIDLDNVERIKTFEATNVVEDLKSLERAIRARLEQVRAHA